MVKSAPFRLVRCFHYESIYTVSELANQPSVPSFTSHFLSPYPLPASLPVPYFSSDVNANPNKRQRQPALLGDHPPEYGKSLGAPGDHTTELGPLKSQPFSFK